MVKFYQVFVQELYKAVIGTVPIPKSKSRSNSTRYLYRNLQGCDWYHANTKVQKQVEFYWMVKFYQVFVQELYKAVIGTMSIPKSKSRLNSTGWLNSNI